MPIPFYYKYDNVKLAASYWAPLCQAPPLLTPNTCPWLHGMHPHNNVTDCRLLRGLRKVENRVKMQKKMQASRTSVVTPKLINITCWFFFFVMQKILGRVPITLQFQKNK